MCEFCLGAILIHKQIVKKPKNISNIKDIYRKACGEITKHANAGNGDIYHSECGHKTKRFYMVGGTGWIGVDGISTTANSPIGKIVIEASNEKEENKLLIDEQWAIYAEYYKTQLGTDQEALDKPKDSVEGDNLVPTVGESYDGVVVRILDFGAFVRIAPGTEGLVHISEVAHSKTKNMHDVLSEGDEIKVKLKGIDSKTKKISLSIKALLERPENTK